MADGTEIEWSDATWNIITGCSVVSAGCTNCYAMRLAGTRLKNHESRAGLTTMSKAGPVWNGQVRFNAQWLEEPIRWRKPRKIFVCAHGDLFHEGVPDEWLDQVFAVMALCPQHQFQVLTKRPERMRAYQRRLEVNGHHPAMDLAACMAMTGLWNTPALDLKIWPLPNVWLGVSVEDQTTADARIPHLLDTPAAVRFISAEPLLGPVDLRKIKPKIFAATVDALTGCWSWDGGPNRTESSPLDWVIVGGESGPGARPMHVDWARGLRDQCLAAGVPLLFKQWGEYAVSEHQTATGRFIPPLPIGGFGKVLKWDKEQNRFRPPRKGETAGEFFDGQCIAIPVGKKRTGRRLDGVIHDGFPQVA